MLRLVCDFTTTPAVERSRVPGTPQRVAAAHYLHETLRGFTWNTTFQNFTGQDYEGLEKGSLAAYASCTSEQSTRLRNLTFSNVVATKGSGSDIYILMAHYESKWRANRDPDPANHSRPVLGANDGASGVGVLLEISRAITQQKLSLTAEVRILLVDGEDGYEDCHPDAGSLYYARMLPAAERDRVRSVLLLDMVGDANASFCYAGNDTDLRSLLKENAQAIGMTKLAEAGACDVFDDHTPFMDLNMSALDVIDLGDGFPPYWHTTQDTPDKLDPATMREVTRVVLKALKTRII